MNEPFINPKNTKTTTVIVGRSVDVDELASNRYRSSNSGESIMDWVKKMLWIGSSIAGVDVIYLGLEG
jgi:hypothetical protein